jgi:hypothetical protein
MTEHDTLRRDWREDWILMNALHDAFRRDLDQLLDTTADDDAVRRRWRLFRDQLLFHHTAEDSAMWPPVRAKLAGNPSGLALMDQMQAEHALIDPLLAAIDDALGTRGRERIHPLLTRLRGTLADHLAHEETEALPLISRIMTKSELGQIGRAIARIGGLRQVAVMFPWALSEARPEVRDQVLGQLPPSVRVLYRAVWLPRYRRRARRP